MANIPVEKKTGNGWLGWLIGLIILIGAIFLLLELFDDEPDTVSDLDDTAAVETVPADDLDAGTPMDTGAITSLAAILDADTPSGMTGRNVRISGLNADIVSGDSTYWVSLPGEGMDRKVFVVLSGLGESETGAGGSDGRFNVDEGENMTVVGTLHEVTPDLPDTWGVTDAERAMLEGQVYIRATSLRNLDNAGS